VRLAQRPPGLYTERPWRRTAGLGSGSIHRRNNAWKRVEFRAHRASVPSRPEPSRPQSATPPGSNHGQNPAVIYPQAPSTLPNSEKRAMFAVYSFGRGSRRGHEEVDGDPSAAPALANAITMPTHTRPPQAGAGLLTPQPRQRR